MRKFGDEVKLAFRKGSKRGFRLFRGMLRVEYDLLQI